MAHRGPPEGMKVAPGSRERNIVFGVPTLLPPVTAQR